jgi:hypothetical protein
MGFYRNSHPDSKVVMQELDKIRRVLSTERDGEFKHFIIKIVQNITVLSVLERWCINWESIISRIAKQTADLLMF